ncbi:UNVERIFIED_CONTAM: hypothetical protein HDU68_004576 [Siphonaria sp. JEL0065]|nr:hypothetical protein HDU68_004576 [Siphonaria sp. JEL0065]
MHYSQQQLQQAPVFQIARPVYKDLINSPSAVWGLLEYWTDLFPGQFQWSTVVAVLHHSYLHIFVGQTGSMQAIASIHLTKGSQVEVTQDENGHPIVTINSLNAQPVTLRGNMRGNVHDAIKEIHLWVLALKDAIMKSQMRIASADGSGAAAGLQPRSSLVSLAAQPRIPGSGFRRSRSSGGLRKSSTSSNTSNSSQDDEEFGSPTNMTHMEVVQKLTQMTRRPSTQY